MVAETKMKTLLTQIVILLKSIESHFIKGNFEERLKMAQDQINSIKGAEEERWKMMRAMEKYLGIEFDRSSNYVKNQNEKE